ncbi:hypothetical protein [Alkalibacillus haloalkaliphilus]|uniref:hypothetical protein n=1 Tax=Alkalibacillus haloalkaliphilus TaxID=94136 RepID=UPI0002FF8A83|nr:hypothetical protein [Alkalibacillus haloalkaliphilus]
MKLGKITISLLLSLLLILSSTTTFTLADTPEPTEQGTPGLTEFPEPIDEETWQLPRDMTWEDYQSVPGIDWNEADQIEPELEINGALILVDFPDQEFILSQPEVLIPQETQLV